MAGLFLKVLLENIAEASYFREENSYCDVTKFEFMDKTVLVRKIRNKRNKFRYIARLRYDKYIEVLSLLEKKYDYISKETKEFMKQGLIKPSEIVKKLGL